MQNELKQGSARISIRRARYTSAVFPCMRGLALIG